MALTIKHTVHPVVYLGAEPLNFEEFLLSTPPGLPDPYWKYISKIEHITDDGSIRIWSRISAEKFLTSSRNPTGSVVYRQKLSTMENNKIYNIISDPAILPYTIYDGPETGVIITSAITTNSYKKLIKVATPEDPDAFGPYPANWVGRSVAEKFQVEGLTTGLSKVILTAEDSGAAKLWNKTTYDRGGRFHPRQGLKQVVDFGIHHLVVDPAVVTNGLGIGVDYTDFDNDGVEKTLDIDDNDPNIQQSSPPTISLIGDNPLTISLGDIFLDPGVDYYDQADSVIDLSLTTTGEPDNSQIGNYQIEYKVTNLSGASASITRTVTVVAPDYHLEIIGDNPLTLPIDSNYSEPGFIATRDGVDINNKVQVDTSQLDLSRPGEYIVKYRLNTTKKPDGSFNFIDLTRQITCRDVVKILGTGDQNPASSSNVTIYASEGIWIQFDAVPPAGGNPEEFSVELVNPNDPDDFEWITTYFDPAYNDRPFDLYHAGMTYSFNFTPNEFIIQSQNLRPVIELTGSNPLTIQVDQDYIEPGYTLTDPEDGSLSIDAYSTVESNIDNQTVGEYTVTYNGTDKVGAQAETVTRQILVVGRDTDEDGIPDTEDDDIDGDGVKNTGDADPYTPIPDEPGEPTEGDEDGDGVADVADADHPDNADKGDFDGDGVIDEYDDDIDGDEIPNHEDDDNDNDGIPDGEDDDDDGDGVPNETDDDDDGDGVPDIHDADHPDNINKKDTDGDGIIDTADVDPFTPVDPANPVKTPDDIDGDGIKNELDNDIDGDGKTNDVDKDDDGDSIPDTADADHPDNTGEKDTDGDGIIDSRDNDIDNDGIKNIDDDDIDGDGVLNQFDKDQNPDLLDTDDDGVDDTVQARFNLDEKDTDGDGIIDKYDTDDDNDGTPDTEDGDDDGDGVPDEYDADHPDNVAKTDANGDGITDDAPQNIIDNANNPDDDGDGVNDEFDDDIDGDGVLNQFDKDQNPNITDTDDDGIDDSIQADSNPGKKDTDSDGITDDGDSDIDGDGVENQTDDDDDGDDVLDTADADHPDNSGKKDTDSDGTVDEFDDDIDGDGIPNATDDDDDGDEDPDIYDADHPINQGKADTDDDGRIDDSQAKFNLDEKDTDGDGIIDKYDTDDDNDGTPDTEDGDDDGDGVPDTADADHPANTGKKDTDGDGTIDSFDDDIDGDDIPNSTDDDDDDDGVPDISDADHPDNADEDDGDGDGIIDTHDSDPTTPHNPDDPQPNSDDTDGDGIKDEFDDDIDGDGIPNATDDDDDGDGVPDVADADHPDNTDKSDTDGDGTVDEFDDDDDGDGVPDVADADHPDNTDKSDTDGDGTIDEFDDDIDGDDIPNATDDDDDGDGVPDVADADHPGSADKTDTDGDGTVDEFDDDDDGDGVPDVADADHPGNADKTDTDGDGTVDEFDDDDDGDGILDVADADHPDNIGKSDLDGDGTVDEFDEDDDGDGILDVADADHPDNIGKSDLDQDGTIDQYDIDIDGDGKYNEDDTDDDNDGVLDTGDADHPDNVNAPDTDGDGVIDIADADQTPGEDFDNDGVLDPYDADINNDGFEDLNSLTPPENLQLTEPVVLGTTTYTTNPLVSFTWSPVSRADIYTVTVSYNDSFTRDYGDNLYEFVRDVVYQTTTQETSYTISSEDFVSQVETRPVLQDGGLADGVYLVRVAAYNDSGEYSYAASHRFTVDNNATPPGEVYRGGTYNINDNRLSLSYNATPWWFFNSRDSVYSEVQEYRGDSRDGPFTLVHSETVPTPAADQYGNRENAVYTLNSTIDGYYYIQARNIDPLGNASPWVSSVEDDDDRHIVQIDSTGPLVVLTHSRSEEDDAPDVISWTIQDDSPVQTVVLDIWATDPFSYVTGRTITNGDTSVSITDLDYSTSYAVYAYAIDNLNNQSSQTSIIFTTQDDPSSGGGDPNYPGGPDAPALTFLEYSGQPEWNLYENGETVDAVQTNYIVNGVEYYSTYWDSADDDFYGPEYRQYQTTRREDPAHQYESSNWYTGEADRQALLHGWNTITVRVQRTDGTWSPWSKKYCWIVDGTARRSYIYDDNYNLVYIPYDSNDPSHGGAAQNIQVTTDDFGVPTITWDVGTIIDQSYPDNVPWMGDEAEANPTYTSPEQLGWTYIEGGAIVPQTGAEIDLISVNNNGQTLPAYNTMQTFAGVQPDPGFRTSLPADNPLDWLDPSPGNEGTQYLGGVSLENKTTASFTPVYDHIPSGEYYARITYTQRRAETPSAQPETWPFGSEVLYQGGTYTDNIIGLKKFTAQNNWSPSDAPNIIARYETSNIISNGTDVTGWEDSTSNSVNLTLTTPAKPPVVKSSSAFNGNQNTVDFGNSTTPSNLADLSFNGFADKIVGFAVTIDLNSHMPVGASNSNQKSSIFSNYLNASVIPGSTGKMKAFELVAEYGAFHLRSVIIEKFSANSSSAGTFWSMSTSTNNATGKIVLYGYMNYNTGQGYLNCMQGGGGFGATPSHIGWYQNWSSISTTAPGLILGQQESYIYPLNGSINDVMFVELDQAWDMYTDITDGPNQWHRDNWGHIWQSAWDYTTGTKTAWRDTEAAAGWMGQYWMINSGYMNDFNRFDWFDL